MEVGTAHIDVRRRVNRFVDTNWLDSQYLGGLRGLDWRGDGDRLQGSYKLRRGGRQKIVIE